MAGDEGLVGARSILAKQGGGQTSNMIVHPVHPYIGHIYHSKTDIPGGTHPSPHAQHVCIYPPYNLCCLALKRISKASANSFMFTFDNIVFSLSFKRSVMICTCLLTSVRLGHRKITCISSSTVPVPQALHTLSFLSTP